MRDSAKSSAATTAVRLLGELAGFTALLFVTRFIARGHLAPQMDQECHIGAIAADVLAHGVRFPLMAYAPNEYDNGSFFSGLLAAVSFSLFGHNMLALKLVTHVISAAGAVATLWLLRGCLEELGLTSRRARWTATAVLVVEIALAPRVVTMSSMYAVGNHAEGSALGILLLALFSRRLHTRSAARTAAFWALVGLALYLNKGTFIVLPVLGAAELALAWRSFPRLLAALGGFALGGVPELLVVARRHGHGWATVALKAERNSRAFPAAFLDSLRTVADHRIELLLAWAVALAIGTALLARSIHRRSDASRRAPVTLGLVVGFSGLHLAALAVMAQGGIDSYAIYGYPTIAVLFAVLVGWLCAHAAADWGETLASGVAAASIAITLVLYRPAATSWGLGEVSALWHNRSGAVCSWRFAEGFMREQQYGLAPPGQTREQHAVERCRSLVDETQILDCIGGIARELNWRHGGKVEGAPPAELDAAERRAYAFYYGTHRGGDMSACGDFRSPELAADCAAAVRLDCLVFGDMYTRFASGRWIGRPRCALPALPVGGYWAAMRSDLLSRPAGPGPNLTAAGADTDVRACGRVFDDCYGAGAPSRGEVSRSRKPKSSSATRRFPSAVM